MSANAKTSHGRITGSEEGGLFVSRGVPHAAPPMGEWPAFSKATAQTMILDRTFAVESAPFAGEMRGWAGVPDEVFGR